MVCVELTVFGVTKREWLPVLDFKTNLCQWVVLVPTSTLTKQLSAAWLNAPLNLD